MNFVILFHSSYWNQPYALVFVREMAMNHYYQWCDWKHDTKMQCDIELISQLFTTYKLCYNTALPMRTVPRVSTMMNHQACLCFVTDTFSGSNGRMILLQECNDSISLTPADIYRRALKMAQFWNRNVATISQ